MLCGNRSAARFGPGGNRCPCCNPSRSARKRTRKGRRGRARQLAQELRQIARTREKRAWRQEWLD